VDGKRAEPLVIDGIFAGVSVTQRDAMRSCGSIVHRRFFIGAAVTILTLSTMQIFAFVKRSRHR
jgi:hypothetical protein